MRLSTGVAGKEPMRVLYRQGTRVVVTGFLLLVLPVLATGAQDLGIISAPKEIHLSGAVVGLAEGRKPAATIVLAGPFSRQAEIGADEINQQVGALCGARLPVKQEAQLAAADWDMPLIVLGQAAKSPLLAELCRQAGMPASADNPGPQGYHIGFLAGKSKPVAVLAGCDPPGLLCACRIASRPTRSRIALNDHTNLRIKNGWIAEAS